MPLTVDVCSQIKALKEQDGEDVRALDSDDQPVDPGKVQTYLKRAFGTRLEDAERTLTVGTYLWFNSLVLSVAVPKSAHLSQA